MEGMHGTLPWYVARSSGLVAWALLAGAVVWGLMMTSKLVRQWIKNSWLLDLHRWLGGLALIFTGVHVAAILADSYVHFGLASALVPFASHWHPVAVSWGIASFYLLVAVELTSLARRRLPHRLWRRIHLLSFPLFVTSTVHGLSAGTDARTHLAVVTALLTVTAVAVLTALRLDESSARSGGNGPPSRATNRTSDRAAALANARAATGRAAAAGRAGAPPAPVYAEATVRPEPPVLVG
jgi:DMSO/TMAO reductase YedYZ heme-binding membrane subunit